MLPCTFCVCVKEREWCHHHLWFLSYILGTLFFMFRSMKDAGDTTQREEGQGLATKFESLGSIPNTHIVEREKQHPR